MSWYTFLMNLVVFWLFVISDATKGVTAISEEEIGCEKEYQLTKKPSLKTIKTKHEDIYDCINFYKQPAFDHPLLKNHTFYPQMRPSSILKVPIARTSSQVKTIKLDDIKLKNGGCPIGTVPIRRVSKDEYIKMKRFTKQYASRTKHSALQPQPGTHLAVAQSKFKPSTVYNGVGGHLSIHSLPVTASQYSMGEIILQNGGDSIQVGWTVNPMLYKDNKTRLFQYLNAGQSHCFNTLCPGFVSVRQDLPIDLVFDRLSIYGKRAVVTPLFVYQDAATGNWWLGIGDDATVIGFWPQQIFTELAHSATYIAAGGEAYGPPDQPLPPMGNGHYPIESTKLSAFCAGFFVLNEQYKPIENQDTEEYRDIKNYAVYDELVDERMGHIVFYGGPY